MSEPLNVLFITADQWRGDCLSSLGHQVLTPNLDALAADGVHFTRHYANTAPCGPSRASLHTGLYLQNHRSHANGTPLDARHTNWALEAKALGYDPVLLGYTDTSVDPRTVAKDDPWLFTYEGPLPGIRPLVMMDDDPTSWTDWLNARGYATPDRSARAYGERAPGPDFEDGAAHPRPLAYPVEVDDTSFLVSELIGYLKTAKDPFVAHLSLLRPHPPWVAAEPYNAMYDPRELPPFFRAASAEAEARQHPWLAWRLSQRQYRATDNEARLRRLKAVYYGLMSRVDAAMGVLMAFLRESGLIDRTLIIFTSDHGEEIGEHWLIGKGGYFDGSYHIPLIVRDPRPRADAGRGARIDRFTENIDVMPTLLEAIGGDIPRQCDGESLAPFINGQSAPSAWRTEAHWEFDFRDDAAAAMGEHDLTPDQCAMNVLRGERYKYVHFTRLPPLLFDMVEDPHEMHDLSADPAHAPVMLACVQRMLSWRMAHDERTLTHIRLTHEGVIEHASARY
jgi:arylsulfatase A-like enzyme